jgi:ABC-type phosphate transport system substrate-binding protein
MLKKVKPLALISIDSTGQSLTSIACQSDIADGSYPLVRPINFVAHTMNDIVGTGFVNFLYSERSGRIALKSGLVPTLMPQRVIHARSEVVK